MLLVVTREVMECLLNSKYACSSRCFVVTVPELLIERYAIMLITYICKQDSSNMTVMNDSDPESLGLSFSDSTSQVRSAIGTC